MTERFYKAWGMGVLLLVATAVQAQAGIVYDNGAPNAVSANEMTQWIQAEDFQLGVDTVVTDVHFWSAELFDGYQGSIYYRIYDDAAGVPDETSILSEGLVVPTRVFDHVGCCGLDSFAYGFDIPGVALSGGVTYWLGLHNGPLSTTTRSEFYWETTDPNATATGHEDDAPFDDGVWFDNGDQHAFQLTDDNVPEPASLMLIGTGVMAGLARRVRRRS